MDQLQHDPLTKSQVKQTLYEYLYTPVEKQFRTRIDTLIIRNTLLGQHSHKSFHYKGVLYSCDSAPPPRKWNRLVPQLKEQMEDYLRDMDDLNRRELPYVLGFINQVLNSSNHFEDYLRLLPECLHPPLKKLIASCPCHNGSLVDDRIEQLVKANQMPIALIKQRMVSNLIL